MVINTDPDYKKKKAAQEKLNRSEIEVKQQLLAEASKESTSILSLALMYAKNFERFGVDVTEKWVTTQQQMAVLQQIFNRGYEEGITKGRGMEREQIEKNYTLTRKTNPYFSDSYGHVDINARTDSIPRTQRDVVQPANAQHYRKSTKKRHKRK